MPAFKILGGTLLITCFFLASGCESVNLGDIYETPDAREVMPGPGVLDGEDGEPALTWTFERSDDTAADKSAPAVSAQSTSPEQPELDEKEEFEQFKIWNDLRTNRPDSEAYREFRLWMEYREFKKSE